MFFKKNHTLSDNSFASNNQANLLKINNKKIINKTKNYIRSSVLKTAFNGFVVSHFPRSFYSGVKAQEAINNLDAKWALTVGKQNLEKFEHFEKELQYIKKHGSHTDSVTAQLTAQLNEIRGDIQVQDDFLHELVLKVKKINSENLNTPPSVVAVPILTTLNTFAYNETMRNMFANLLASSMDNAVANKAMPSLVPMIQQMTPLDALLFENLSKMGNGALADIYETVDSTSGQLMYPNLIIFDEDDRDKFKDFSFNEINASLDNLVRMNFVQINTDKLGLFDYDKYYKNTEEYKELSSSLEKRKQSLPESLTSEQRKDYLERKIIVSPKSYKLTALGSMFRSTCLNNK